MVKKIDPILFQASTHKHMEHNIIWPSLNNDRNDITISTVYNI